MARSLKRSAVSAVNRGLAPFSARLVRVDHDWNDTSTFIPFESTKAHADAAGVSIGDYIEKQSGTSQRTLDFMADVGVFERPLDGVVEVGPGTGRYLEKTLGRCVPGTYEIYETAAPWREYLVRKYAVKSRGVDGYTLQQTVSSSMDLAHAHKVFCSVPFMVSCSYWAEFCRVVRRGGWIVFDIMTERCLAGDATHRWVESKTRNGAFPAVMPSEVARDYFERRGFELIGTTFIDMPPGVTEVFAFRSTE